MFLSKALKLLCVFTVRTMVVSRAAEALGPLLDL